MQWPFNKIIVQLGSCMYQESQVQGMNVNYDLKTVLFSDVNYTINRMDMSPGGMTQLVFSSIIIYIILIRPNKHNKH